MMPDDVLMHTRQRRLSKASHAGRGADKKILDMRLIAARAEICRANMAGRSDDRHPTAICSLASVNVTSRDHVRNALHGGTSISSPLTIATAIIYEVSVLVCLAQ